MSSTSVTEPSTVADWHTNSPPRRLFVAWQHPQSRLFSVVGALEQDSSGYVFRYVEAVRSIQDFTPFLAFPDLDHAYRFASLPPFFSNRVMSPNRPDYPELLRWLGLNGATQWPPWEILARSEGRRATDTVQIFAEPAVDADGVAVCTFLVHGVRHVDGAAERILQLEPGQVLTLDPDPNNPVNPRALRVKGPHGHLGWVPDALVDYVWDQWDGGRRPIRLVVGHVNGPEAPMHLRLLCVLTSRWEPGYRPFSGEGFRYLSDATQLPLEQRERVSG